METNCIKDSSMSTASKFLSNYLRLSMKNKLARLLPILALIVAVPTFTSAAQANPSAQSNAISTKTDGRLTQAQPGGLKLTPEQKTKIEQLEQSTSKKIEAVLNPEQLKKFQQIQQQAQASNGAPITLTEEQKGKLQAIKKAKIEELRALLPAESKSSPGQGAQSKSNTVKSPTPEQEAKIKKLIADGNAQMEAILTPEQKTQLQAMKERSQSMGEAYKSLESTLTADQKTKITTIQKARDEQLKTIVTGQKSKPQA
jgi:periplasmic protein CpxP/Spy